MWGGFTAQVPRGLAAGTGAWTTDWPTQHRSQLNHWVRGAAFKPLYSLGVLPSWARNPVLGQRTTQPKGYPARNPQHTGYRVGQARGPNTTQHRGAMVPRLTSVRRLDVKWGPTMSPPIIPVNTQGELLRTTAAPGQPPTWKDHQRGVFWVSLMLPPCSNRTPRGSRDLTYPRTRGGI